MHTYSRNVLLLCNKDILIAKMPIGNSTTIVFYIWIRQMDVIYKRQTIDCGYSVRQLNRQVWLLLQFFTCYNHELKAQNLLFSCQARSKLPSITSIWILFTSETQPWYLCLFRKISFFSEEYQIPMNVVHMLQSATASGYSTI